jgi:hypothetical protein
MTSLCPFCLISTQYLESTSRGSTAKERVKLAYSLGDLLWPSWARKYCSANTARRQMCVKMNEFWGLTLFCTFSCSLFLEFWKRSWSITEVVLQPSDCLTCHSRTTEIIFESFQYIYQLSEYRNGCISRKIS